MLCSKHIKEHKKRDIDKTVQHLMSVFFTETYIGRPATSLQNGGPEELSVSVRYTHSKSMKYDNGFFCQGKVQGVLHKCQSGNIGTQIHSATLRQPRVKSELC